MCVCVWVFNNLLKLFIQVKLMNCDDKRVFCLAYLISLAADHVGKYLENTAVVKTPILQILLHSSG